MFVTHIHISQTLIENGAKAETKDKRGNDARSLAAERNQTFVVEYLDTLKK